MPIDQSHQDFLNKMSQIYENFEKKSPIENGTRAWKILKNEHSLYLVVLRYENRVNDILGAISEKIASIAPAIIYDEGKLHTTLMDTVPDVQMDGSFEKNLDAIKFQLSDFPVQVDLKKPLANEESVIISGTPNKFFIPLSDQFLKNISMIDKLKKPWGSHITISRFTSTEDRATGAEVARYLKSLPELWICEPIGVEIWDANIWPQGFTKTVLANANF